MPSQRSSRAAIAVTAASAVSAYSDGGLPAGRAGNFDSGTRPGATPDGRPSMRNWPLGSR